MAYAELHIRTNFTFLEGASHPEEYVRRAKELGLEAIAITDRNSLAGVVRAHGEAREAGIRTITGAQLDLADGQSLIALPRNRAAYGRLSRLITIGRRRVEKGSCELHRQDVRELGHGMIFIALPPDAPGKVFARQLEAWAADFPGHIYCAASHLYRGNDTVRIACLEEIAAKAKAPLVASNDVLMHVPRRRVLADILTCIREGCTIDKAGRRTQKNAERHLKSSGDMLALFNDHEEAVERTVEIARRINFSLDELKYEYPDEVSDGRNPQDELERLTTIGLKRRYRQGAPEKVREAAQRELSIIAELSYAPYFLSVYDIVRFARSQGILCQGRGSAANSMVCYALGITAIGPERMDMVFERFVSAARNEPPDIDVDFEHERREEVIQYIYEKYGRERAGLAATVICYRARSAIREVGKALGLSVDTTGILASQIWGWSSDGLPEKRVREVGLDPAEPRLGMCLELAHELMGFPRHLSQHVGGFIITRSRLDDVVPIENAAMEERTVVEWDKDDLDTLGILKIDVLGLGMLTCIRKAFGLLKLHYALAHTLASVPEGDDAVYDMLCTGDSVGVFQVESRAQMSFLPRMKPRNFYDLVIEVAIVRPGPIQGDMVHPYIRRRNGEEQVEYPSEELKQVLHKTLGVPLFQEQAMRIAIVGAGFSPEDADRLRRAMATFRKTGTIHTLREKFHQGMLANGYSEDFATRCFSQIEGFGEYGFPESHAASFALLVYISAWLKCHYPATFACALLNSQPMGFYAPAQIVRDARDHGVEVRPVDVNFSDWDSTLELGDNGMALRLGLRQIKGMREDDAEWISAARGNGYAQPADLWRRAGLKPATLRRLARADAFGSMEFGRREVLWEIAAIRAEAPLPLFELAGEDSHGPDAPVKLPPLSIGEQVAQDYQTMRLTLRAHPLELLRHHLARTIANGHLVNLTNGRRFSVCGLVLVRQRPGTAKGVIFLTLEDETGVANIVVWANVFERFRRTVMTARLMRVRGKLQREGIVTHLVAEQIEDMSWLLDKLDVGGVQEVPTARPRHPRHQAKVLFPSRDFH
ncbi:MAG: error-prone DNA polymerase [Hyphomicrobiales bacterium]